MTPPLPSFTHITPHSQSRTAATLSISSSGPYMFIYILLCYEDIRFLQQCRHLVFIIYLFSLSFLFYFTVGTLYTLLSVGRFILHISKLFV